MASIIDYRPVGILDSGVGGLSVLRHIQDLLPDEDLIYFADQAHVPYGPQPANQIRDFVTEITNFLLSQGSKLIVVACNTASAAALTHLRRIFPDVPIVGMEPAVKPGAIHTRQGKIGILATAGTFGSQRYANLMARYAQGIVAFEHPCPGLVEQVEAARLDDPETELIIRNALEPMLASGVDTVVLGCTHYPFVLPVIRRLAGPDVTIIDPAPAVARQVKRVLSEYKLLNTQVGAGDLKMFTTGSASELAESALRLLGHTYPVFPLIWREGRLTLP